MGKNTKPVIGYWHSLGLYKIYCIGPVDAVRKIVVGGETAWTGNLTASGSIVIKNRKLFGGEKKEGGLDGTLDVRFGEVGQMPHAYLQEQVPGPWPAGRGLLTTVWRGVINAMNPHIKLWELQASRWQNGWVTPVFEPTLAQVGEGMNPAHIIYQAITDPRGRGYPVSNLDATAFQTAAQTFKNEDFGLCLRWARSTRVGDFVRQVCDHVGAMWYEDPADGRIGLRAIRADYDPLTLQELGPDDIVSMESWTQPGLEGSVNQVTVVGEDWETGNPIQATYQNLASIQAQGAIVPRKIQLPGLWNTALCARVAARECHTDGAMLARMQLKAKRSWGHLKRGDVIALSWPRKGVVRMPVRVLEVDHGTPTDRRISLKLAQDQFGLPATTYVDPAGTSWAAPDTTPQPVADQRLVEASYRDLASRLPNGELQALADDACFVIAYGLRPTSTSIAYDLRTRPLGGAYRTTASGAFTPAGTLSGTLGKTATALTVANGRGLHLVQVGTELLIDDELLRVDAIDPVTGACTVARGCVDTVPAEHLDGARVWFTDDNNAADPTEYLDGETVEAKLLTRTRAGTLDESLAPVSSVLVAKRQARPYPPGLLRLDGLVYPASRTGPFVVSWAHRDRVLQADQLVDTEQASVGPERTTRYALRLLNDATAAVLVEKLDIAGTSATCELNFTGNVRLELYAISDRGESRQRHRHVFGYTPDATPVTEIVATTYDPNQNALIIDGGGA